MLLSILSLPVVHWQFVSVREQPEAGTATAKQERAQVGMSPRFWAEATARVAAKARMEKRIFVLVCEECLLFEKRYVEWQLNGRMYLKRSSRTGCECEDREIMLRWDGHATIFVAGLTV